MTDNERASSLVIHSIDPPNNPVSAGAAGGLDDPRVLQAMEEYLKLLQSGWHPDRDAFLARYPHVAQALAVCLQGLDFVHAAGAELSHPAKSGVEAGAGGETLEPAESLGDFRIIRPVGKGGMGIVYEAEQISLRRRVALKVLPFAAAMDPRHLQRFHNEARAAASLEHPHITPVYFVGCERGVHFYAMKFIDGQTLAQRIEALRQEPESVRTAVKTPPAGDATEDYNPSPLLPAAETVETAATTTLKTTLDGAYYRRVAEWGIQAAEALEYAHSVGIVHRDIKPANLMLDGQGHLWVTDFGLARVGTDSGLTMTGDLVGTLRYMSPEQALAKHGLIDHRTDVYSLGVTLYELLTL
jgi:serine/threonine protein kinase